MNKVWRLIFTILATAIIGLLGWFAANAALRWFAVDTELSVVFTPVWVQLVYRVTYLLASVIFGVAFGRAIFRQLERTADQFHRMSVRDKVALGMGLVIGITLSAVISLPIIFTVGTTSILFAVILALFLGVVVTYLCTVAALSMKEEIHFYMPPPVEEEKIPQESFKILDTNVIIDGRIADVARAGFLDGHIYVPGFVLEELQHIADSADAMKRARGRRGLDILRAMQTELQLTVRSYDKLAPDQEPVDARLVRLAKALNGAIVTNDFNLNKVASLQGVPVLNVNELANALKPVVLPGEEMRVAIVKEGREAGQGVGYLDDGTMVVVEGGRPHLGDTVPIVVTSVLQTQAGKMIFSHLDEESLSGDGDGEDAEDREGSGNGRGANGINGLSGSGNYERNVRAYTGRRPRRPVR